MHLDFTINIPIIITLLVIAFYIDRTIRTHMVEHEMLMKDYCDRKELMLAELPTRSRPAWHFWR